MKYNYLLLTVLIGIVLLVISCQVDRGPLVGQAAPDFALSSLDGKLVRLSDFKGQLVLLNVWATWCPPCRAETPDLEAFFSEYRDKGVVVLAVNLREDRSKVASFVAERHLTFPVLLDTTGKVGDVYRVEAIPTSFFIDRDGVIRGVKTGAMSQSEMVGRFSKLLGEGAKS
ncbi:MAG: TlpA family protein disulfide reductase [Chloroflexi bacterium]|nr:TlpA family protein disulfide reductase [Chloroflexota bacterium]